MFSHVPSRFISIDILKMFLAFLVIYCHFGNNNFFLNSVKSLAVPIFMILSFYFLSKNFEKNFHVGKRFFRLIIPLIGWAIIYSCIYFFTKNIKFQDFLWQTTTGHSEKINPSMWFQIDLIFLTLLFVLIKKINKRDFFLFLILFVFSYIFQYMGINNVLFGALRYELKYPLGRFIEMVPFMVTGYFIHKFNLLHLNKKILLSLLVSCLMIFLFFPLETGYEGFGYSGINLFVGSNFLLLLFWMLPFQKFSNKTKIFLSVISKYTLGIYCIHRLIESFLYPILGFFKGTVFYCIIIYFVSYLICWGISKIPNKIVKMLV